MLVFCLFLLVIIFELYFIQNTEDTIAVKNKKVFFLIFIEFFIVLAFRGVCVIPDTLSYAKHFTQIDSNIPFYRFQEWERFGKGYLLYEQFVHNEISDYFLVFNIITTSILLYSILHFFRKESQLLWLCVMLFLFSKLSIDSFNAARQALAMVIILWGTDHLKQGDYKKYALIVLIAYLFHSSAQVCVVLLIIRLFQSKGNLLLYLMIVTTIIVFYYFENIMTDYVGMSDDSIYRQAVEAGINLPGLFNVFSFLPLTYVLVKMHKASVFAQQNKLLYLISLLNIIMCVLSVRLPVFRRFSMYFMPYFIVYYSNLYYELSEIPRFKRLSYMALLFLIIAFFVAFIARPEYYLNLPYTLYKNEDIYYNPYI